MTDCTSTYHLPHKLKRRHIHINIQGDASVMLLKQRVFAIAAGYADLDDHEQLRLDVVI